MFTGFLGRVIAAIIDYVIALLVILLVVYLLSLIGFVVPGEIVTLAKFLAALYALATLIGAPSASGRFFTRTV